MALYIAGSAGLLLEHTFVDLGMSPLCESFVAEADLNRMEPFYPLHAYVCDRRFLVQLGEFVSPGTIFTSMPISLRTRRRGLRTAGHTRTT